MTIYFIQEQSERGLIKIGYTKHPNAKLRLAHLKMTSPCELIIIKEIEGDLEAERKFHNRFSNLRCEGEWFYPEDELLEFIKTGILTPPKERKYRSSILVERARQKRLISQSTD